jgi:nucleotide-binding universal stress UspA family protein
MVARDTPGVAHLAAFFAQRLDYRLTLRQDGHSEALVGDPLGPETRLVVLGADDLHPEIVLQTICISPCPVVAVPRLAGELWACPSRALRALERVFVCGADGSREALTATAYAARLAEACAARLLVTHICTTPRAPAPAWATEENPLTVGDFDREHDLLAAALGEARKRVSPLGFRRMAGSVAGSLSTLADEESAMLIAIGSDGLDPGRLVMSGSHTADLLAQGSHPVVIVPSWTRVGEPTRHPPRQATVAGLPGDAALEQPTRSPS